MAWTKFEVISKGRQTGNPFNLSVVIEYQNDDGITSPIQEPFPGDNLTDAAIAAQAYKRIKVLQASDAALDAITLGPGTLPDTLVSPEQQAVIDANVALGEAVRRAQLKALNDPDVDAALGQLDEAKTALTSTAAAKISAG